MKKQFLILLSIAIELTAIANRAEITLCMMLFGIGIGMNGLAVLGNGDKMPVLGLEVETPHHRPTDAKTHYRWFIDRIALGGIMISVGDIVIEVGFVAYIVGTVIRFIRWVL